MPNPHKPVPTSEDSEKDPIAYGAVSSPPSTALIGDSLDNLDIWTFTPLRDVQFFMGDLNSITAAMPAAHDAFLVVFALTAAGTALKAGLKLSGLDRRPTIPEIIKRLSGPEELSIDEAQKSKAEKNESDSETEPLVEQKSVSAQPKKIKICVQSYILDPENEYRRSYAALIYDEESKQYFITKKRAEQDLSEEERKEHLKKQFEAFKKRHASFKEESLWQRFRKSVSPRKAFESSLGFFFKMAMWYWTLWFITAAFIGFSGAFALAFGSPILAFALPVVLTLIEYGIRAVVAYRHRNSASDPKAVALVESLLKVKLAEEAFKEKVNSDQAAALKALGIVMPEAKDLNALKEWVKTQTDPNIKALVREHAWEAKLPQLQSKLRVWSTSVITGGTFFIMVAFLAWPLTDLLALHGMSVAVFMAGGALASAISIAVVPLVFALVVGIVLGVMAYKEASKREAALQNKIGSLGEGLKKDLKDLNDLVLEVELRRAYLQTQKVKLEDPKQINLMERMSSKNQSKGRSFWSQCKKGTHRAHILLAGLGTGTLMVRLVLGAIMAFTAVSLVSWPVISALVLVGVIWGGVKLLQFYQERKLEAAERKLNQISAELESYKAENRYLIQKECERLLSDETAHVTGHGVPNAKHPKEGLPPKEKVTLNSESPHHDPHR